MRTQLDARQELLQKVKQLSSYDEILRVQAFIAGMEAGKAIQENSKQVSANGDAINI